MDSSVSELAKVYCREGRFASWEEGRPCGDSVTPATCVPDYRRFLGGVFARVSPIASGIKVLSLGSGNCVFEEQLKKDGYEVVCSDALPESGAYAQKKGLKFVQANVLDQEAVSKLGPISADIVYADGVIGHIIAELGNGGEYFLEFCNKLLRAGGSVVISNDASPVGVQMRHELLNNFTYIVPADLQRAACDLGYVDIKCENYEYHRPESGPRNRLIFTAKKT